MRLHLGGHLNWYDLHKRAWLMIPLSEPVSLIELLQELQVPTGEVALTVVNGRLVELEQARVSDGDRVELYPPIGGGSHTNPSRRRKRVFPTPPPTPPASQGEVWGGMEDARRAML